MSNNRNHWRYFVFIFSLAALVLTYLFLQVLPQTSLWIASVSWNL